MSQPMDCDNANEVLQRVLRRLDGREHGDLIGLLKAMRRVGVDGTWDRLRICPGPWCVRIIDGPASHCDACRAEAT